MQLPVNKFKNAHTRQGKPQIGIWSSLSQHLAAEVLADAGFDWVLLDTEHSPNELPHGAAAAAGAEGRHGERRSCARRGTTWCW